MLGRTAAALPDGAGAGATAGLPGDAATGVGARELAAELRSEGALATARGCVVCGRGTAGGDEGGGAGDAEAGAAGSADFFAGADLRTAVLRGAGAAGDASAGFNGRGRGAAGLSEGGTSLMPPSVIGAATNHDPAIFQCVARKSCLSQRYPGYQ